MKFIIEPIGFIHTPFKNPEDVDIDMKEKGVIEILEKYSEGLDGLEEFEEILVVWGIHLSKRVDIMTYPRYAPEELKGIFATRSPHRPNHIGVSVLELQKREKNKLYVEGVDMVDESPVFDIKPVR